MLWLRRVQRLANTPQAYFVLAELASETAVRRERLACAQDHNDDMHAPFIGAVSRREAARTMWRTLL